VLSALEQHVRCTVVAIIVRFFGQILLARAPRLHFASLVRIEDEVALAFAALVLLALFTAERA
jgi:hypothetical protein